MSRCLERILQAVDVLIDREADDLVLLGTESETRQQLEQLGATCRRIERSAQGLKQTVGSVCLHGATWRIRLSFAK